MFAPQASDTTKPTSSSPNPTASDRRIPLENVKPKYEQRPLISEGYSDSSVTHAHTTVPSEQKKSYNGSLYSYLSTRDIGSFIREFHGRGVPHLRLDERELIKRIDRGTALMNPIFYPQMNLNGLDCKSRIQFEPRKMTLEK
jgi:hypothetical protein